MRNDEVTFHFFDFVGFVLFLVIHLTRKTELLERR